MSIRVRTGTAVKIAGIDRDRFNEAVSAGRYPCAPKTQAGSARVFDTDDMVALVIYGHALKMGFDLTTAGETACLVRNALGQNPNMNVASYRGFGDGQRVVSVPIDQPVFTHLDGIGYAVSAQVWQIATIRTYIEKEIEIETSIVGED